MNTLQPYLFDTFRTTCLSLTPPFLERLVFVLRDIFKALFIFILASVVFELITRDRTNICSYFFFCELNLDFHYGI